MATEQYDGKEKQEGNEDAAVQPDQETLHTTDPQEHMDGPISSLVKKAEDSFDSNDEEEKDTDE